MENQPFAMTPKEYEPALNVMGDKINALATLRSTGTYAITLVQGQEGNGPPPHTHPWNESFFVTRGNVEFMSAGTNTSAVPGTLVHFPAGTVHSFRFCAGGADVLEITGTGSPAVEMFTDLDREIPSGPTDIPKTMEILERHGVTMAE